MFAVGRQKSTAPTSTAVDFSAENRPFFSGYLKVKIDWFWPIFVKRNFNHINHTMQNWKILYHYKNISWNQFPLKLFILGYLVVCLIIDVVVLFSQNWLCSHCTDLGILKMYSGLNIKCAPIIGQKYNWNWRKWEKTHHQVYIISLLLIDISSENIDFT